MVVVEVVVEVDSSLLVMVMVTLIVASALGGMWLRRVEAGCSVVDEEDMIGI